MTNTANGITYEINLTQFRNSILFRSWYLAIGYTGVESPFYFAPGIWL